MSPHYDEVLDRGKPLQPLHLVEEITHRVVNEYTEAICSLTLAADSADAQARATLTLAAQRLRAQVEAHRALQAPSPEGLADLSRYVARVCACMSKALLADNGVRLTVDTDEVWLDADRCWRVGLIVAELIRNAGRHGLAGGPGAIRVEIVEFPGSIVGSVADTGCGAQAGQPGCGQRLVRSLVAELGGAVTWRYRRYGCLARFEFPTSGPASWRPDEA